MHFIIIFFWALRIHYSVEYFLCHFQGCDAKYNIKYKQFEIYDLKIFCNFLIAES